MRTLWPAKDPAETLVATFDYSLDLDAGETIATAATTCTLLAGTDSNPSSVPTVNGELTVEATSNTQLTFRLKGTDGTVRSASLTLA